MAALRSCGKKARVAACAFVIIAAEFKINAHLSIFGRIDNLTNEQYSEVFGFPALGRVAYGGVKLRF
jgi:vitamin B12 transporter